MTGKRQAQVETIVPQGRTVYQDVLASLTTLVREQRCDGCPWPRVCEQDRTCWREERHQPWQRSRVELRQGHHKEDRF